MNNTTYTNTSLRSRAFLPQEFPQLLKRSGLTRLFRTLLARRVLNFRPTPDTQILIFGYSLNISNGSWAFSGRS
jgi:hypothetical protein